MNDSTSKSHRWLDFAALSLSLTTGGAVDIAEETAAQPALQNAAAELAERLVLKLVK